MKVKARVWSFALLGALFLFACSGFNKLDKANALYKNGKYDEALKMYEEVLKKKPNEISALKAVADIKLLKKDFMGAIDAYKLVIETDPTRTGVTEMVSILTYGKAAMDKVAATVKSMGNGKTEIVNEILKQISIGNNYVKIDYLGVLAKIGNPASSVASASAVAYYLDDEYFGIRVAALETLGNFNAAHLKEAGIIQKMIESLEDDNSFVAEQAVKSFGNLKGGADEAVPALIRALERYDIVDIAKQAIVDIGPAAKSTVPELIELTDAKKPKDLRITALDSLGKIGKDAKIAVPALIPLAYDKDTLIKAASSNALTKIGRASKESVPELLKLVKSGSSYVSLRAISELSDLGKNAADAMPVLKQLSKDSSATKEIRDEAKKAYERIREANKPQPQKKQVVI